MNQSDTYYRAWLGYRDAVKNSRGCVRDSHSFAEAGGEGRITVRRAVCTVDEEWILAIEKGLTHIEKAIREDRQFIYSTGEVIPIEKVRHVSKDSVEHLARHAELITRVEDREDIIPDKLYTVERLSDYAVYENRFLYMLLCYLRDFVTLRYQKILELTNRYDGRLAVDREVTAFGRTVTVKLDVRDERQDDPYLREHNTAKVLIDRMDLILKTVQAFLATPLMESAAKAAMLKPPITKTNVLKMDNNFKGAVALYDYIIAYEGEGYTVTEDVHEISPFGDELSEDMAEAQLLLTHLAYRYGLGLTAELKAARERDEAEDRMAELKLRAEQLESLRRRMEQAEETPETYILALEKQLRALRHEIDRAALLYTELDERKHAELELTAAMAELTARTEGFDRELLALEQTHAEELQAAELRHRAEQMAKNEAQAAEQAKWAEAAEAEAGRHSREVADLRAALAAKQAEVDRYSAAYDELTEQNRLLEARVLGQRALEGQVTAEEMDAMTDKSGFDELERELEAFIRLYEQVWKQTKRKIRKELLNSKYIKGQIGKK